MDANSLNVALLIGAIAGWLSGKNMKGMGFGAIGNIVVASSQDQVKRNSGKQNINSTAFYPGNGEGEDFESGSPLRIARRNRRK